VLQGDTLAPYLFIIALDYALRKVLNGKEEELGFHLRKRKSRRIWPECITDLDFADDIALISEQINQAQTMLERVESAAAEVGIIANPKKTKVMVYNTPDQVEITSDGTVLEVVNELSYLGSLVSSSAADIKQRIALACTACNKISKIWKSSLPRKIKTRLFRSTFESVLLYGSEAWTLPKQLAKKIDGCYTRLLRSALGLSWKVHVANEVLYGELPNVTVSLYLFTNICFFDSYKFMIICNQNKHFSKNGREVPFL
jgi:hypothetical protein